MLKLGEELSLPLEAVTETFGILAKRGAGKSNLGVVMAEEMYKNELPFVAIDPVGKWWGMRSAADGKAPGIPIPIFGGQHADVPLERGSGVLVADLVVDRRLTCILDLFDFSEGDKIKFLCDFFERLYKRNTEPLHLFFEEADDYIPQRPMHEQARLLRAAENIVRRGRANGLGMTMITQRSAALNKNVLTQVETLFVLRTTAPNDRQAIAAWVEYSGLDKELLGSLHELKNGEAWVWSPQWLGQIERVKIRRRWTYDSGATPKMSAKSRKPATLADVDLDLVRKNMADVIKRAKQEDPRELKAQIKRLESELAQKPKAERIEVPILSDEQIAYLHTLQAELVPLLNQIDQAITGSLGLSKKQLDPMMKFSDPPIPTRQSPQSVTSRVPDRLRKPPAPAPEASEISKGCMKILDALAWIETVKIYDPKRTAIAFLAGQSPKSSQYDKNLTALRRAHYMEYLADSRIQITDAGRAVAHPAAQPLTTANLQRDVLGRLPRGQAAILEVLISEYPKSVLRSELAERAGQSRTSSQYEKNLSKLRGFDLIDYPDAETAVALPVLFLES